MENDTLCDVPPKLPHSRAGRARQECARNGAGPASVSGACEHGPGGISADLPSLTEPCPRRAMHPHR
ncbi:unnamed protein product [Mycena citricolor]|uniref:Uncharacterized protein n=1 Tax=Mycena citricolor TaxID=2018698 RepID=A0AAD2HM96_9AGAR|nr:unnamed protein product [Mycena citricolor]